MKFQNDHAKAARGRLLTAITLMDHLLGRDSRPSDDGPWLVEIGFPNLKPFGKDGKTFFRGGPAGDRSGAHARDRGCRLLGRERK